MIAARGLTRHFGARIAVDDVSLEVAQGEIVALLGPNGAGKTTTMRMLAGLIAPTKGSVTVDGILLSRATGSALRSRIGFLTEAPGLWDRLTVRENLRIYAGLYGLAHPEYVVDSTLETLGLVPYASTRAAELSKGLRQKTALARALLHAPSILLLDEPTSGLDPEVARSVRGMLDERRQEGCAVLVSTHNLDEAERLADRVAVLHTRLLALDRPAALRERLTTGRVIARVAGDGTAYAATVRAFDTAASIDGDAIMVRLPHGERDTPAFVRALVAAGADVLEIRPEVPALEDVYLHLMADEARTAAVES
ncbi:MAG TPA: ABC transporter ATP-binding protein [Vicinamibacterales bacterium]